MGTAFSNRNSISVSVSVLTLIERGSRLKSKTLWSRGITCLCPLPDDRPCPAKAARLLHSPLVKHFPQKYSFSNSFAAAVDHFTFFTASTPDEHSLLFHLFRSCVTWQIRSGLEGVSPRETGFLILLRRWSGGWKKERTRPHHTSGRSSHSGTLHLLRVSLSIIIVSM